MMKGFSFLRICLLLYSPLLYADFVIQSGQTVTTTQTLAGDDSTGIIEPQGAIIVTSGNGVDVNSGIDCLINNAGTVSTSALNGDAVFCESTSTSTTIINSGLLEASNSFGRGIQSDYGPTSLTVINSGAIIANRVGISSGAIQNTITNSGSITVTAAQAAGILVGGDSAILNSGTITVLGINSTAIDNLQSDTQITNTGSITVGAQSLGAIYNEQNSVMTIINWGTISGGEQSSVIGDDGTGMLTISNRGTIISAPAGYGINTSSGSCTLCNSGSIQSYSSVAAIYMTGTSPNLVLMRGSNIRGAVSTTHDLNLYVEDGLNLFLSLAEGSAGFGTLGINNPYVIIDDAIAIAVIDPTGFAMQADITADLSDSLLDGLYPHRGCLPCGKWIEGVGSYRRRGPQGNNMAYAEGLGGLLGGWDLEICRQRFSLLAATAFDCGVVNGHTQTASVFMAGGGAFWGTCFCDTFLDATAFGGYIRWNNTRVVENNLDSGGEENAKVAINGAFATAEITLGHSYRLAVLSMNLRYAGLYLGSYNEVESAAAFSTYSRNVNLFTTRFEAALGTLKCCWYGFQPFIGLYGRYQLSGYEVKGSLLGQPLSFCQGGPQNLVAFLAGARGKVWRKFFYNVEYSLDSADSWRVLGDLKYCF